MELTFSLQLIFLSIDAIFWFLKVCFSIIWFQLQHILKLLLFWTLKLKQIDGKVWNFLNWLIKSAVFVFQICLDKKLFKGKESEGGTKGLYQQEFHEYFISNIVKNAKKNDVRYRVVFMKSDFQYLSQFFIRDTDTSTMETDTWYSIPKFKKACDNQCAIPTPGV